MIETEKELTQALEQLVRMQQALASIRKEVFSLNPRRFSLLAEGPLEEIRKIQSEVNEYIGVTAAEENDADLWIRIQGKEIAWPNASTSILTAFLDALRKGITTVAEYLATGQLAMRPTTDLKDACDLRIVGLRTGSLRVGIRLPDEEVLLFPDEKKSPPREALRLYLETASWVGSQEAEASLEKKIQDPKVRRLVLNAVKNFIPRQRGSVDSIEISGREVPEGRVVKLSKVVLKRIEDAIDGMTSESVQSFVGDLREIDLDKRTFILRNTLQRQDISCEFEEDLLSIAKEALDRKVNVTGARRLQKVRRDLPLRVTRIEVLDDIPGDESRSAQ